MVTERVTGLQHVIVLQLLLPSSIPKSPFSTAMEDILADSFGILGEEQFDPAERGIVRYGPLTLTVAAKVGYFIASRSLKQIYLY